MLPTFLVVGAAKCGTTSLFHYLNQHPEVFIPEKKECFFFSSLETFHGPRNDQEINVAATRTLEEYEALFAPAGATPVRGDVSHDYLYYYRRSIPNILRHLGPGIPIVIILRDPRERAYSHYKHHLKAGTSTDRSFEQALALESQRVEAGWSWNWHYVRAGLYADAVGAYLDSFERVRVYLFDDLARDAASLVPDLYRFVGADPGFQPELGVENAGVSIRSNALNRFLRNESWAKQRTRALMEAVGIQPRHISRLKLRAMQANTAEKDRMKDCTRERLTDVFKADVSALESLLHRDLTAWRT